MDSKMGMSAQDPTFTKGQDVDLHELAKGWKAAIARCTDPATRYVFELKKPKSHMSC